MQLRGNHERKRGRESGDFLRYKYVCQRYLPAAPTTSAFHFSFRRPATIKDESGTTIKDARRQEEVHGRKLAALEHAARDSRSMATTTSVGNYIACLASWMLRRRIFSKIIWNTNQVHAPIRRGFDCYSGET